MLIESGSFGGLKTNIIFAQSPRIGTYVLIDVSQSALGMQDGSSQLAFLTSTSGRLSSTFSYPVALPAELAWRHKIDFPGSTMGDLKPIEASRLVRVFRAVLASGGRLIVGVDLKKGRGETRSRL